MTKAILIKTTKGFQSIMTNAIVQMQELSEVWEVLDGVEERVAMLDIQLVTGSWIRIGYKDKTVGTMQRWELAEDETFSSIHHLHMVILGLQDKGFRESE